MAANDLNADSALKLGKMLISSFYEAREAVGLPDMGMNTQKVHDYLAVARDAISELIDVKTATREYATDISRESTLMALNMRIKLLGVFVVDLQLGMEKNGFAFDEIRAHKEIAAAALDIDILLATPTFNGKDWGEMIDGTS